MNKFIIILPILISFNVFAQGFVPENPNTSRLRFERDSSNYQESIAYLYLKNNYEQETEKNFVIYYEHENRICSFNQKFAGDITYFINNCSEEGGVTESIEMPKMTTEVAKDFIDHLFYSENNSWVSNKKYEPEGAGCYYEIKQKANYTIIQISCGC